LFEHVKHDFDKKFVQPVKKAVEKQSKTVLRVVLNGLIAPDVLVLPSAHRCGLCWRLCCEG
jgi:hypothetical protein